MLKKLQLFSLLILAGSLTAQTVSTLNPAAGNTGQTLPIIISGQNTSFTQGSISLLLSQGSKSIGQGSSTGFSNIISVNNTSISANLSVPGSATLGFYTLSVNSGSSTINRLNAFEVRPSATPRVAVSPAGSKPGQNINVSFTVSGASFKNLMQQNIEKVWLNLGTEVNTNITNIQVLNATTFTADISIPASATKGLWDVNVYTDDAVIYQSPQYFEIDNTFSRKEFNSSAFSIYPNPVNDEFSIILNTVYPNMEIKIVDLSGKAINADQYSFTIESQEVKVSAKRLATGTYLVQLQSDSQLIGTKKLIKK
jgi:hypothetical protein